MHAAYGVFITIFKQSVELAPVPLKSGSLVKYLSEDFLNYRNSGTNSDLTANLFLNIWSGGEMIGMGMRFDDPLQFQPGRSDEPDELICVAKADVTGCLVEIENRIYNGACIRSRVPHHIADGVGRRI